MHNHASNRLGGDLQENIRHILYLIYQLAVLL